MGFAEHKRRYSPRQTPSRKCRKFDRQLVESDLIAATQLRVERLWDGETRLGLGARGRRDHNIDRCPRFESCKIAVEFPGSDIKLYGSSRFLTTRIRTQDFGSILNLDSGVSRICAVEFSRDAVISEQRDCRVV